MEFSEYTKLKYTLPLKFNNIATNPVFKLYVTL